ncbi:unnamed protein product [Sphagnum troendelagicum]|uniref:Uncharacterized protein n=1 Tax=Sphagnum troendelagicum TaxID=128251 RepID=A0ABP0TNC7_9BRYO
MSVNGSLNVDAKFIAMWRWENLLQTEFLKSTLEMLWAMCCYQTSVLLLASGTISSQTFNDRGWNRVWAKQPVVAPGLR